MLARLAVVGALSGFLWAACASGPKLPPKDSSEDVELYFPGMFPTEEFKTLADFTESALLTVPDEQLIAKARSRAARLGADALLIRAIRLTTEGAAATDLQQEERKVLEAVAVYYPSRHPKGP